MSYSSVLPPENVPELLRRCQTMTNQELAVIAARLGLIVPSNLLTAKGWVGQLLEQYLGADADNLAQPDFTKLQIELKTVPVSQTYKPLESTYVCTLNPQEAALSWQQSWVYRKLRKVLWVPILASKELPIAQRKILAPILYTLSPELEAELRADWEELMEMYVCGHHSQLTAKFGKYLHVRPKAANSKKHISVIDQDNYLRNIVPKGFYLRPSFTAKLFRARPLATTVATQTVSEDLLIT